MAKKYTGSSAPDESAPDKQAKKALKAEKKAQGKERRRQLWQAFQMQRKQDAKLLPLMIGAVVLTALVFVGIGLLLGLWWWFMLILGLLLGAMLAMIIFSRRVQANVYKQAEGQPGAAAWSLQNNLRGKWRVTPTIAATSHLDAVHRVVGRPGIVLVAEGVPHRVKPLLAQEKKRYARIVGETPIYDVVIGNGEGQVPLAKLNTYLMKLPRNIAANSVSELDNRLSALTARTSQGGIPKGPLPAGAKMRNVQRTMQRRAR